MSIFDADKLVVWNAAPVAEEDMEAHTQWATMGTIQRDYMTRVLGDSSVVVVVSEAYPTGICQAPDAARSEARARAEVESLRASLKKEVLFVVTQTPGIDNIGIAARLGANPFIVSDVLSEMERDGWIEAQL